ncbi:MFS transporter [Corynebacterium sp. YIM 101645]|uniref:MFS transporter n=1 Tax=Corynebacterium lemuris TaxID=1859292 RepID=A0ABT2FUL0_9CORY|nr:MFS transporter [Corynebacterium lemuris]MCS5478919.1 MFS transporter [Corynebacterium lemuris]
MDLRNRIDAAPMSRAQLWIIGVCVALNMSDGFDVLAMAFSASSISNEWDLSGAQLGLLLSAALFGMAAGSIFVSQIADIVGRRATILWCTVLIAVGMGLAAMSTSYEMLLILRILTGVAIGTLQACLNVVVAEYSSAKRRPISLSLYTAGQPIGGVLGGLVAALLLSEFGWRAIFLLGAVINIALVPFILRYVPESIDYLVTRRPNHALAKINGILARIGQSAIPELPTARTAVSVAGRWGQIFAGRSGLITLLISTAFFMLMAGFYFANSWTPRLIVVSGFSDENGVLAGTMFSLGGIFGAVLFGPVAARFTVQRSLIVAFLLAGAGFVAFASSLFSLSTAITAAAFLGFITSACMAGLFALGPQFYAAEVRAAAVGFVIGAGRIGAILSPIIVGALLDGGWTADSLYYLFLVPMIIAAGVIVPLGNRRFTGKAETTATVVEQSEPTRPVTAKA